MKARFQQILIVPIMLALVACGAPSDSGSSIGPGGTDSSASSAGAGPSVAGGGVGGTGTGASIVGAGTGVITGFDGGLVINSNRRFEIDSNTQIELDGGPIGEVELRAVARGLVAGVMAVGVNADFTIGAALSIRARHLVVGPVTDTAPLRVLGQTVLTTGDTVLPEGLGPDSLKVGDILMVSGYASAINVIQATRLELARGDVVSWILVGAVSRLSWGGFIIGGQRLSSVGILPDGCGDGLVKGDLVRVRAAPYELDSWEKLALRVLDTVTDITCLPPALQFPGSSIASELPALVEGLVTSVAMPEFSINGQQISITPGTIWLGGRAEDVILGARVEAQGLLHMESGVLGAASLTFSGSRVRIVAPLTENNDGEVEALGLKMKATPLTEDAQNILSGRGRNLQVDVRGFVDSSGQLFVSLIENMGSPEFGAVRLRGQVDGIYHPPMLRILGLRVDTSHMTLLNSAGETISTWAFFRLLYPGAEVELANGNFDGENMISASPGENTTIRIVQ